MPYGEDRGFERKMYHPAEGETWKCSECGVEITELPFPPDPQRMNQLRCRDCHAKFRQTNPRPSFRR
ncbi:hypothetical protein HYW30_00730 [Candidatus Azambacteria bacterium]|nr:hypothetical protein [Candidatus Azambacteria bacterium]MBI2587813.1 hypothetical protein [Candidatus Azambacteria bacterium]